MKTVLSLIFKTIKLDFLTLFKIFTTIKIPVNPEYLPR